MIQELKTYVCDHIPKDDILEVMRIIKNDNCVVRILWNFNYSETYDVLIANDSTLESVKRTITKKLSYLI